MYASASSVATLRPFCAVFVIFIHYVCIVLLYLLINDAFGPVQYCKRTNVRLGLFSFRSCILVQ